MAGLCTPCGITGTTGITTGVAVAVGPGVTVATGVGVALAGGAVTTSVAEAALPGPAGGAVTGLVVFGYVPGPVTVTGITIEHLPVAGTPKLKFTEMEELPVVAVVILAQLKNGPLSPPVGPTVMPAGKLSVKEALV